MFRPPFQRWCSTHSGARRAGDTAFLFGNFFAFGFAKQMADVSQTRKICASGFKEKVDKKEVVAIVSGTAFRYQNLLDAFSFEEVAPKKKLCKKKRAFLR